MSRHRIVVALSLALGACGGGGSAASPDGPSAPTPDAATTATHKLADFLPALPTPDGTSRKVFAGAITQANPEELIVGPAATGLVGDYFMRNSKVRIVIESPQRVIGVVPWGGNIVDAVFLGDDGKPAVPDHLGEISLVYLLGRTCAHTKVEVLRDGAQGGPAVIRATGKSAVDDYVDLKGLSFFNVPAEIDPDVPDSVECATTYTLEPDSDTVKIAWTLYNGGKQDIQGPFGMVNDTGGEIMVFNPGTGFTHLNAGLDAILQPGDHSVPYAVYQGPGVAYGLIPRLAQPDQRTATLVVGGVSVLVFGLHTFTEVTNRAKDYLHLAADGGVTNTAELVVARDGARVEEVFQRGRGTPVNTLSGTVTFTPSGTPARARVIVCSDANGNGQLDDTDPIVTYFDTAADGTFSGPLAAGTYLLRADIADVSRSSVKVATLGTTPVPMGGLTLPDPATIDFRALDADDLEGPAIPVKLTIVGTNPVKRDVRVRETQERGPGIIETVHAAHGTSMAPGDDLSDPPLTLPANGSFRIYFSRGPEWSVASVRVDTTPGQRVVLDDVKLKRVLDTSGYVATAFHEHSMGSPDSPVAYTERVTSLVTEGVELFAGTDHDRLTDYQPVIDGLGLDGQIQGVIGVEATPFAFGHFNAYPLDRDPNDPSGGAVDWGQGHEAGFAMLPSEIWAAYRQRGAKIIQVCHPRSPGLGSYQGYFWRAGLAFDFDARTAIGDPAEQEVPNDYLRLPPGVTLFSDQFDVLETWINFGLNDSDGDGIGELYVTDEVLRDWMNFLSLGKVYTPMGNGDTHVAERDAAGVPRTMVRVPDDSPDAIAAGVADDVWATLLGQTARDVVVTDGPMISVVAHGETRSALGRVLTPAGDGTVTLDITVAAADWVDFDTVEVFANETYDPPATSKTPTSLTPLRCFTTRTGLAPTDPCLGAKPLVVDVEDLGGGYSRRVAHVTVTLAAADIPVRAGATGSDAWLFVRARGDRGLMPMLVEGALTEANVGAFVNGDAAGIDQALIGHGGIAMAFTSAIFLDFDGGGYRAPFQP